MRAPLADTWTDGNKYDGEWKDDKKHGHGICDPSLPLILLSIRRNGAVDFLLPQATSPSTPRPPVALRSAHGDTNHQARTQSHAGKGHNRALCPELQTT